MVLSGMLRKLASSGPLARILIVSFALMVLLLATSTGRADVARGETPSVAAAVHVTADEASRCSSEGAQHRSGATAPCCGVAHAACCCLALVATTSRNLPAPASAPLRSHNDPVFASRRVAPPLPPPNLSPAS